MATRSILLAVAALLIGGCCTVNPTLNDDSDRDPVVSPTNISNQHQEDDSLYLEDMEHWWEVLP